MTASDGAQGSVTSPPRTGDGAVDAALARLEETASGSVDEQLAAGEAVHQVLQGRLADIDGD